MKGSPLVMVLVGALGYYGFLRFRGVIVGAPWSPVPAGARQG